MELSGICDVHFDRDDGRGGEISFQSVNLRGSMRGIYVKERKARETMFKKSSCVDECEVSRAPCDLVLYLC